MYAHRAPGEVSLVSVPQMGPDVSCTVEDDLMDGRKDLWSDTCDERKFCPGEGPKAQVLAERGFGVDGSVKTVPDKADTISNRIFNTRTQGCLQAQCWAQWAKCGTLKKRKFD